MAEGVLLGRVLLSFGEGEEAEAIIGDLSAAALGPDGALWVVSDELSGGRVALSRLVGDGRGRFAQHRQFALEDFIELPAPEDKTEADIEGLDYADGYLWFTGSHSSKRSKPKGKNSRKDVQRLAEVTVDPNRYLLGRVPLADGMPARTVRRAAASGGALKAARLADGTGGNVLIEALSGDAHLGAFLRTQTLGKDAALLPLASKENGFDIEGLAVFDRRLLLGLRGPVLRGWATMLEIEPEEAGKGQLGLAALDDDGRRYAKHFLDLGGLGIRELARDGDDLLILAGPTMALDGTLRVYRLRDATALGNDSVTGTGDGRLSAVFELPLPAGGDYAEGLALLPWRGQPGLLVVYDGPLPSRRPASGAVFADVYWLHA